MAVAPSTPAKRECDSGHRLRHRGGKPNGPSEAASRSSRRRPTACGSRSTWSSMGSASRDAWRSSTGPGDVPIHVWSPASSAYRDVFEKEWRIELSTMNCTILHAENLGADAHGLPVHVVPAADPSTQANTHAKIISSRPCCGSHAVKPGGWTTIGEQPDLGLLQVWPST